MGNLLTKVVRSNESKSDRLCSMRLILPPAQEDAVARIPCCSLVKQAIISTFTRMSSEVSVPFVVVDTDLTQHISPDEFVKKSDLQTRTAPQRADWKNLRLGTREFTVFPSPTALASRFASEVPSHIRDTKLSRSLVSVKSRSTIASE